jgi:hypothetical protein
MDHLRRVKSVRATSDRTNVLIAMAAADAALAAGPVFAPAAHAQAKAVKIGITP